MPLLTRNNTIGGMSPAFSFGQARVATRRDNQAVGQAVALIRRHLAMAGDQRQAEQLLIARAQLLPQDSVREVVA